MFIGVRYHHVCMGKVPLAVTSMIVCVALVVTRRSEYQTGLLLALSTNVNPSCRDTIVGGALFETGISKQSGGVINSRRKQQKTADLHLLWWWWV